MRLYLEVIVEFTNLNMLICEQLDFIGKCLYLVSAVISIRLLLFLSSHHHFHL